MRVAVVAVSSAVPAVELDAGVGRLRDEGLDVSVHPHCLARHFTYAGTDSRRASAFWEAATDPAADVVWAARGGYGAARVLPTLDRWTRQRGTPPPKLLVGYSDLTVLHEFVRTRWDWPTLHAPMPSAGDFGAYDPAHWRALIDLVRRRHPGRAWGDRPLKWMTAPPPAFEAELVGGNLSLWASLAGTRCGPTPGRGRVVFFEDVGERFYRIDRMVTQVVQAGLLDGAKAIVLGDFTDCEDDPVRPVKAPAGSPGDPSTVPLRPRIEQPEALAEIFGSLGLPVATGLPVGHGPHFAPLPLGAAYRLTPEGEIELADWTWLGGRKSSQFPVLS